MMIGMHVGYPHKLEPCQHVADAAAEAPVQLPQAALTAVQQGAPATEEIEVDLHPKQHHFSGRLSLSHADQRAACCPPLPHCSWHNFSPPFQLTLLGFDDVQRVNIGSGHAILHESISPL